MNPLVLFNVVREEKNKKEQAKKRKQKLMLTLAGIIAIFILVIASVIKYREGKVQVPFDSDYVKGESLSMIYDELDDAGFENIVKESDDSGWLDDNEVISVSIDNQTRYSKDTYKEPDVNVVITYSSSGRIYATDLLQNWQKLEYEEVVSNLREAGFTNITVKAIDTAEKELDQITASIELNGLYE